MRVRVNADNVRTVGRGLRKFGAVAHKVSDSKLARVAAAANPKLGAVAAGLGVAGRIAKKVGSRVEAAADTYGAYKDRLKEIEDMEED